MSSRPRAHRLTILISLVVLLALAPLPVRQSATASAAESPSLTLDPDHGRPGDELLLRGTGFPADAAGEVRLALDGSVRADVRTDGGGGLAVPLLIPDLSPGDYELTVAVAADAGEDADPDVVAEAEGDPSVTFTVDQAPTPTEAPSTATATEAPTTEPLPTDTPTDTPTEAPPTDVATETPPAEPPDATPAGPATATSALEPADTDDGVVTGAATQVPRTLTLDKVSSKYNGAVVASLAGFAPNSAVTLRWPRAFAVDPNAPPSTDLLASGTTDGTGATRLRFHTPLEPFTSAGYLLTARDAEGHTATATLRVIPRILLNETEGPTTTRLRVYFYGFAPSERIEVRWHDGPTSTSGFVVLKTLTVAATGRASSIVTIPSYPGLGAHLVVGKVIGVSRSASTTFTVTRSTETAVALAAGDIASCDSTGDEATAAIVAEQPGTVMTLGDTVYESGSTQEFADCYDPSWGAFKGRTRPATGNHEYRTANAAGYFTYFGSAAGDPTKGYYSYELGAWHVVVLNSSCAAIGGCQAGSAQERWLRADLAAHPAECTLAYMHHPLFSSGEHGGNAPMRPLWQALYDADADLVLTGHDHDYERFAPQDPQGAADADRGIREFVVGSGGRSHYGVEAIEPNSEVHSDDTFGVLKLTLAPTGYAWQFLPVAGASFTDSGATSCHDGDGPIAAAGDRAIARPTRPAAAGADDGPGSPLRGVALPTSAVDRRQRLLG